MILHVIKMLCWKIIVTANFTNKKLMSKESFPRFYFLTCFILSVSNVGDNGSSSIKVLSE